MSLAASIAIPVDQIAGICRSRHIQRLSLFGSALRPDFGPMSDIDMLVEFEPNHVPGYLGLGAIEEELSRLFPGRKVDLQTPGALSAEFRERVQSEAQVLFVAAER
jgi:predicted nucleotidyltransferase